MAEAGGGSEAVGGDEYGVRFFLFWWPRVDDQGVGLGVVLLVVLVCSGLINRGIYTC